MAKLKYTKEDLKRLQSLSLEEKIAMSKLLITEWYEHWQGKVCVSYSGGKDSTVLLKLVREVYPEVPAVYVDTRLDFPEVREHVKATDNVVFLKPEMSFREVIDKHGFCYPSKEVARHIESARSGNIAALKRFEGKNADDTENIFFERNYTKWKYLIDLPFLISDKCYNIMKEKPLVRYQKEMGLKPYMGVLASESFRRRYAWYQTGFNSFSNNKSKPLSIWTEQDILRYIVEHKVKIPSVYGDIVEVKDKLQTTGEKRTGCIFCPIASHLEKKNKFQRLKESHLSLYNYCMSELGLDEFLTAVGVAH